MTLNDAQITEQLAHLAGWERDGNQIRKEYKLKSFPAAMLFVNAIAHLAEAADHHPDILVQYKTVTLTLSTHSAGGLTGRDFALAELIDALPIRI